MIIEEFLGAILPTKGRYCIVGIDKTGAKSVNTQTIHRRSNTVEQAVSDTQDLMQRGYNLYYCTGGLGAQDNRQADNVVSKRELYIDIDCGVDKPYANIAEGSAALKLFLVETGLPKPTIIYSGNGFHVHWFFKESISCEDWLPVATALKALCKEKNFYVDPTVMADLTRILRIPGTVNLRGGATVELVNRIIYHDFESLKNIIGVDQAAMLRQAKKTLNVTLDASTKSLLSNRQSKYETIVIKSIGGTGCAQVKYAVENSDKLSEPLWRAHLSNAHVCVDRDYAIDIVSRDYPDYEYELADRKAQDTKGPQSCEIFQTLEQASLCAGCSYAGKITAPVQLGYEVAKAPENTVVTVPQVDSPDKIYVLPTLPFPYFFGKNGGVYRGTEVPDKETGLMVRVDELIYPHNLYLFRRMTDPDLGDMLWLRLHLPKDGVREFVLAQSSLMALDKFRDAISAKGITSTEAQLRNLQRYVVRTVEELQHKEKAELMHARFGWTQNDTFIIGDRDYRPNGVYHAPPASQLIQLAGNMEPKGDIEAWRGMANIYDTPGMEAQAFVLFAGFGSPLMHYSMEGGCLINLFSNDSGTGKTTAMMMMNSIFGHPRKLLLMKQDTLLSKINRMGTMSSIAVSVDEITNMRSEDVSDFMYSITAQRGRNRMSSKENTERTNQVEWNNICVSTSNSSMADKLRGLKEDPQGELARLIDIRVRPATHIDKALADRTFNVMFSNYGVAGDIYMRYVVANPQQVMQVRKETTEWLESMFLFKGPERFHANTIINSIAGALIAKQLGLHDIDIGRVVMFLLEVYRGVRETIAQSKNDPESIFSNFLAEHRHSILIINNSATKGVPTAPIMEPRFDLVARFEPDEDRLYIMQSAFTKWCSKNQVNTRELIEDVKFKYNINMALVKKRMSKGTVLDISGSARVYEIPHAAKRLGVSIEPDGKDLSQ